MSPPLQNSWASLKKQTAIKIFPTCISILSEGGDQGNLLSHTTFNGLFFINRLGMNNLPSSTQYISSYLVRLVAPTELQMGKLYYEIWQGI